MNRRLGVPLVLLALVFFGAMAAFLAHPARGIAGAGGAAPSRAMNMSDARMADMAQRYWTTHPVVGPASARSATSLAALAETAFVDTVTVNSFIFDADRNLGTQVDTVRAIAGDMVFFRWLGGVHTVTSGTGPTDPNLGLVINQPIDNVHTSYLFTSTVAETIPYFCQFHVTTFNMRGVLEFVAPPAVGVGEGPGGASVGFASRPWPNPSRGTVSFRYAVLRAGRVHAEILDVRGRLVAVALDAERAAGTYDAAWDGRGSGGGLAPAGRYFVRLAVPGAVQSRAITLLR